MPSHPRFGNSKKGCGFSDGQEERRVAYARNTTNSHRKRDAFASTLTSLDDAFSLKWERAAALPGDRIEALKAFHDRGIFTWVSLEPTLDCDASLDIVERTHGFVDLYKIGRVNYDQMTKTTDWKDYTQRMMALCTKLKVSHYFKHDLQQYLPAGYENAMRQEQHK